MAKQTFTTGQVLTAAQVNSLQSNDFNQTVSVKTAAYTLVAADKGTRIEFNTSGSVTCTVNTGLFDPGDTLVIQNRGAGVVTITAGTATVNTSATLALSQYDAGTLYFVSASDAIFFNTDAAATPLTTKGDLYTFGTSDTRLAVGSDGSTLVADSSASTGLRWQEPKTNNFVINGDCRIAQRGTAAITLSSSTSTNFPVDRFWVTGHSGATTQQQSSISLTGFSNAVRVTRTVGNTTTSDLSFVQTFETATSIPLQGKTVVLSFWARAGANFSPSGSTLTSRVYTGTGTDQGGFGFSWTGTANPINQGNTLTTSWQRFTASGTISASATQVQLFFFCSPTGTAGANDWFEITGVQLEIGSVATPFRTATGTLAGELAACRRYFLRQSLIANEPIYGGARTGSGGASDMQLAGVHPQGGNYRTAPSISFKAVGDLSVNDDGTLKAVTSLAPYVIGQYSCRYWPNISPNTLTANRFVLLEANTNTYVDYSAEL